MERGFESKDNSLQALVEHHHRNPCIKVVNLSRNFGKEVALNAGIDCASAPGAILIAPHLQNPPELIGELVEKWREGYDVVSCYAFKLYIFKLGKKSSNPLPCSPAPCSPALKTNKLNA